MEKDIYFPNTPHTPYIFLIEGKINEYEINDDQYIAVTNKTE